MQTEKQSGSTGPVTLDDVRVALGDANPFETNASKLRGIIKRGSNFTIQKHLEKIRSERIAAAQPPTTIIVPKAPEELMASFWEASWNAAQVLTLSRLDSLTIERDGLRDTAMAQSSDIAELTTRLDDLEAQAQDYEITLGNLQADAETSAGWAREKQEQTEAELNAAKEEITKLKDKARHAAEIASRDAQIQKQTMQATIDNLTNQIGELKALRIATALSVGKNTEKGLAEGK